jgi:acetyl esterase/lipase
MYGAEYLFRETQVTFSKVSSMNRLAVLRFISWLRREPMPISTVAVPFNEDADEGVLLHDLPTTQVARKADSDLRRSVTYSRATGRGGKERTLRMDVHVPQGDGPFPVVVYLPGGGFVVAPRQMARTQRGHVADAGFVVASLEYRTVKDGAKIADGMTDVLAAISYLREHANEFKVDVTSMALWGESAGGYLAALTGTSQEPSIPVRAVVTIVGASDLSQVADGFDDETASNWSSPESPLSQYVGNPPPETANPIAHVSAASPPFLLFHGDDDRIVSPRQSLLLYRALTKNGVPSTRLVVARAGHGELGFRHNDIKVWTSTAVMDRIVDFLRSHI